jgi:formylglycine-generating enzyme required for sulfatase activity
VKRVAAADLGIDATQAQRTILLPDIDWVEIPGGEFVYQEGERRSLRTFRMARYPVTNVQYQTFIDAGGYRDERWWTGSGAA